MKPLVSLILCAFLTSGCGVVYQSNRDKLLKTATISDYGPQPPSDFIKREEAFLESDLKDPDSAEFRVFEKEPITGIIQSSFGSTKPVCVWTHSIQMNAKNSYGGYMGYKTYAFAWRDGKILAEHSDTDSFWNYQ